MELDILWDKIRDPKCKRCGLWKTAQEVCLIGIGPTPCEIMIVGEAPGWREEENIKKPFSGRSGKLLDQIFESIGVNRDQFYITNVVKCRPPDNREPEASEIKACSVFLEKEIEFQKPKLIILLGKTAMRGIINLDKISFIRKQIYAVTYHPAAASRKPFLVNLIENDFRRFLSLFKNEKIISSEYRDISSKDDFKLLKNGFSFDLETTGLDFTKDKIISFSFSPKIETSFFTNKANKYKKEILYLMNNSDIQKQSHNLKFDLKFCLSEGFISEESLPKNNFFCSMIASNILDENNLDKDLQSLALVNTKMKAWKSEDDFSSPEKLRIRNLKDADAHRRLFIVFSKKIKRENLEIPFKIDMDMMKVLVSAEFNGIKIDTKELNILSVNLGKMIEKFSSSIPINPNSNTQITEYFKKIGIKSLKLTDKGAPSWSKEVLEKLSGTLTDRNKKEVVDKILNFREIFGIKTKFLDNLGRFIDSEGKVHPVFNQVKSFENGSKDEQGTLTGRLSCKNPNLQQIPRDRENLPRNLNPRRLFIPSHPGGFILSADYNQIEVRIAAHLANDSKLIDFIKRGEDVHRMIASMFYKKKPSEVTVDERKNVKKVVFGVIYMISPRGLSQNMNISVEEADNYIRKFFSMFPEQESYILDTEEEILIKGEVSNIFGRKRRLPGATGATPEGRALIRQGVNFKNQSSAVDIVKIAAYRIFSEIIERGLKSRIFASVHDSIDFDGYPGEEKELSEIVKRNMENPKLKDYDVNLRVPLEASIKIGPNWLEVKDI